MPLRGEVMALAHAKVPSTFLCDRRSVSVRFWSVSAPKTAALIGNLSALSRDMAKGVPGELYVTVLMDDPPPAAAELARAVQLEFDELGMQICVEVRPRVAA